MNRVEEIINKIQEGEGYALSGIILSNERDAYHVYFPNVDVEENFIRLADTTVEEWKYLNKEFDDKYIQIENPDTLDKILVRKTERAIDQRMAWRVYKRDSYACSYCNNSGIPLTVDHYYPEEKGGETTEENLKSSCRSCNKKKGNMLPEVWEAYRVEHSIGG